MQKVKRLINHFENDRDHDLQDKFKKHTYVGMLTPNQVLLQFETKLIMAQVYPLV